ncbi:hypothetical protein P153DRAFT_366220 [Dothidotthia symphoricarpi CBS 119687]|uniref:Ankyrin n=1 Tax=Dothidotthia symphoricarpi CBS 119687 TaxID=1392245 RepID=A0A6A6AF99_9PLEO|nr:uncharacterized protein P153DRAFT_366220 [Dothidotthia symphoricarpi CBS 119687]KAF2129708.1 hypothetical protein P153DRAFT_366220 [Dothidotthia symphoricarpi CBS 119687]
MSKLENLAWDLACKACESDNTILFEQACLTTAKNDLDWFFLRVLRIAIGHEAKAILNHMISCGVDVKTLRPSDVATRPKPSIALLEFLLSHGWDINYRPDKSPGSQPFLWFVTSDDALVKWCLDHGANVSTPKGSRSCDPILETCANSGNLASFKLLRSKGAPLGRRTLHKAVEMAAWGHTGSSNPEKDTEQQRQCRTKHAEHIMMVRYLLNVVGLDVNAPDRPPGCKKGMHSAWGTPICYIPGCGMPERDARELTWLLLDRGADPAPALQIAKEDGNAIFAEDVNAWKAQKGSEKEQKPKHSCCLQ